MLKMLPHYNYYSDFKSRRRGGTDGAKMVHEASCDFGYASEKTTFCGYYPSKIFKKYKRL